MGQGLVWSYRRKGPVSQWHMGPGLGSALAKAFWEIPWDLGHVYRLLEGKDLPWVHLHMGMAEVGIQEQGSSSWVSRQDCGCSVCSSLRPGLLSPARVCAMALPL